MNRHHKKILQALFTQPIPGNIRWPEVLRKCRNKAMIEYKGYIGVFEFDPELDTFHGTVTNTNDVISFYGKSVAKLRKEMRASVDEYLAFCQEEGRQPEKPFSGKLLLRTSPELHRRISLASALHGVSMNVYIQEVLEKAMADI